MKGMNLGNMQGMMKQMQKMQKEMKNEQEALEATEFEATDANKLVRVTVSGKKEIVDLEIQEALVDPDDIDMLQDLVIATLNDALQQVDQATEERMGRFTQGMNLPF
ncbi:YbaB/EbfC family nucleoid-associated protein [Aerococcaceae bacterium DSM 111020]|nr:YbaB/EbfC family nucleoid-associated protein [Aerococcaceae bacterium DSM 111020]